MTADEPIAWPELIGDEGSLTIMEKILLGNFIALTQPELIVELGVYRAVTTDFICSFLELNEIPGTVIGFDLEEQVDLLRKENAAVQKYEASGRLQLVPGMLPESLRRWLQGNPAIGLAFVDATHDYPSVKGELASLWPHLAPEGFIVGHDFSPKYDGVRYAFERFAKRNGASMMPLIGSQPARAAGHGSVLVALAPYRPDRAWRDSLRHRTLSTKMSLIRIPWVKWAWDSFLRPFLRRD